MYAQVKKIDWHNYTQIEEEQRRNGIGERGKPAALDEHDSLDQKEALYKVNGFNAMLSDKISLQRYVSFNYKLNNSLFVEVYQIYDTKTVSTKNIYPS